MQLPKLNNSFALCQLLPPKQWILENQLTPEEIGIFVFCLVKNWSFDCFRTNILGNNNKIFLFPESTLSRIIEARSNPKLLKELRKSAEIGAEFFSKELEKQLNSLIDYKNICLN